IERRDKLVQRGEIPLELGMRSDNQQSGARIELRLVCVEEADQIVDLLVRNDPADEQDIGPRIVELVGNQPIRRKVEQGEVRYDRQRPGSAKAQRLEIFAVEFRIAKREIRGVDVRLKLPPASETLPHERTMDADEVLRWRDVVVDQRHPIWQRVGRTGRPRS